MAGAMVDLELGSTRDATPSDLRAAQEAAGDKKPPTYGPNWLRIVPELRMEAPGSHQRLAGFLFLPWPQSC